MNDPLTKEDILEELRSLAIASVRTHRSRTTDGLVQLGVKLGDLRRIAKKIASNQVLANALWETDVLEARLLALLVLKPETISTDRLESMIHESRGVQIADWLFTNVIKLHPDREIVRSAWMDDPRPWIARAGWGLTAIRIAKEPEGLDLSALLDRIEATMQSAAPEQQWTMNSCLAALGIHHAHLRERAIRVGENLGVFRDYPVSKGCTSPFAPIWINEIVRRQGIDHYGVSKT